MIKTKKHMFIIIGIFLITLLLFTTTYAFFNYTRTGSSNVIKTGRIYFNTSQNGNLNVTNLFPISSLSAQSANLDEVTVRIQGDTTYSGGEEFEISLVGVNNTIGEGASEKTIPISYIASYAATEAEQGQPANNIGTSINDYFNERGSTNALYKLKTTGIVKENEQVLVGYIPNGSTGIDGTLTIKAYLDSSNIAITDTYDGSESGNNGTTTDWVKGRVVLTTSEWNSFQNTESPLSFKIKAESNEGIWVTEQLTAAEQISRISTLAITPYGKVYTGATPDNYVWFNNEQWRIIGVYDNQLKIVKNTPSSTQKWQNTDSDGDTWSGSLIQSDYLYNTYYPTLSQSAKDMIDENGKWYVGKADYTSTSSESYTSAQSANWTGKIGLIATYEYLYAAENDGTCWQKKGNSYEEGCASKDWLWKTVTGNTSNRAWTITSSISNTGYVIQVNNLMGYVNQGTVSTVNAVSPVVYLKSSVKITGGNGGIGETDSYKLGL